MTEEEQERYAEWRNHHAWALASQVASFLCEHFTPSEREDAYATWRTAMGMHVREIEIAEQCEQPADGVRH